MSRGLSTAASSRLRRHSLADNTKGWLLVLPTILLLVALIGYPLLVAIQLSTRDLYLLRSLTESSFVGLKNFASLLSDPKTWVFVKNTALWIAGTTLGEMTIGLIVALLLNTNFRGRGLVRGLILVPWVMPPVVAGVVWRWILDGQWGVVNLVLMEIGLVEAPLQWLSQSILVWISLIGITIWKAFPFACVNFLAALQSIPGELYEAAAIDGATRPKAFFHVTLPLLRPVLLTVGLLLVIWRANEFNMVWVVTRGGPGIATTTLAVQTYSLAFLYYRMSEASAVGVLLMCVLVAFLWIYVKKARVDW